MNRKTNPTNLICPECGNIFTIWRLQGRKIFHIKDLYCYNCEKVTKHIEVKDIGLFKATIENTPEEQRTEQQKEIYALIKKRNN